LKGQQIISESGNSIGTYKYDENASVRLLYYAIIMHEYPFSIAQHKYFVKFIKSLRPTFPMKNRVTVRKEVMGLYKEEKNQLYAQFSKLACRVSFTIDTWTSIQNKSYLCVTAHWIDDNWNLHVRCANHILNLVARDGLSCIGSVIGNIRLFVTIIKRSPLQLEAFEKCAKECDLDPKKALSLDVATRWNSTYIMIRDVIYYKNAFDRLAQKNKDKYGHINPSSTEWSNDANISKCLKKFYDVTFLFSGTSYPTANHFFRKFSEIKVVIARWCDSSDLTICTMAFSMRQKFDKYCEMNNVALAVGAFLDPRYKHWMVELYISKMYDIDKAELETLVFMNVINELFTYYSSVITAKSTTKTSKGASSKESEFVPHKNTLVDEDDYEVDLDELYATTSNDKKVSELDLYMSEDLVKVNDNEATFDVLSWWKGQITNFPILSTLARDVLSMQISTVASESAFSSGGRIVDAFRSRLKPEIIETLVCCKDWKIASEKGIVIVIA
jgi:hypothetical protein